MDEDQAASVAAVFQSMTRIEKEQISRSGPPGAPGQTFDELFYWSVDDEGVPFHQKGPETLDDYLYSVYWAQTEARGATGYQDPGWTRTTPVPSAEQLIDARGRHHMYANRNSKGTYRPRAARN